MASEQQMVNRNTGRTLVSRSTGTSSRAISPSVQMVQKRMFSNGSSSPSGFLKKNTSRVLMSTNTIGKSNARS
ncbi:hypothetical protein D3C78_1224350 [compost metagenome]